MMKWYHFLGSSDGEGRGWDGDLVSHLQGKCHKLQFLLRALSSTYFDSWIRDYETAQEHNENDQQIREGLEKAQRLLKQS